MSEHKLIYADELYNTLANKLTWLMKHGYPIYLEVGEDIKEAIEFKLETRVQLVDKLKKKKQDNQ